jgi:hypothetical protein
MGCVGISTISMSAPAHFTTHTARAIPHTQSLLDPCRGLALHAIEGAAFSSALGALFAFAFVWAIGGNLAAPCREAFDEFAREELAPIVTFPGAHLSSLDRDSGGKVWHKHCPAACGGIWVKPAKRLLPCGDTCLS